MLLVQGLASSRLFVAEQPASPLNRRISIIVMNRDAEDRVRRDMPEEPETEEATAEGSPGGAAPAAENGVALPLNLRRPGPIRP